MKMGLNEPSEIAQRKQRVSGIFDGAAATYDQVGPRFFSHFGRRLVEIAQIPIGSKILDVATGRGAVLYPAAKTVGSQGNVIGIDLSEMMVQETKKELVRKNLSQNIEVRQMDAEHLQFSDESFDYVLCGFAIFFFPKLYNAMAEFHRVLKPGGQICVSTFDKLFSKEWNWFYEIAKTYLPSEHEETQETETDNEPEPVFDTPEGLKAIMNAAGFDDIRIFSETAEFVYETEEEFWSTLWSHGARGTLEQIEQETGSDGLQKFKFDVFKKMSEIKNTDGLHQLVPVHVGLATKPKD
jgi:ubiquinone/menaquinone biosynthesis C-methylase UbiE